MQHYRTTLDGVEFFLASEPEKSKPQPQPTRRPPTPRAAGGAVEKFEQMRLAVELANVIEPEDLR